MKTNKIINAKFHEPELSVQATLLTEQLKTRFLTSSNQCYLLLDPFLRDFIDDDVINERINSNQVTYIPIPHPSIDKTKVPFILPLNLDQQEDCNLLFHSVYESLFESHPERIDMGDGRRFCGWLAANSNTQLPDLARYIGQVAIQRLSEDRTILLRFYDPAVLSQLWPILSEVQKRILFGLAEQWTVMSGEAELHTFPAIEAKLFGAHTLGLSDEQYSQIRWIGAINCGLCTYRRSDDAPWISELQAHNLLMPIFGRLQNYTFHSYDELERLSVRALTIHPCFDLHPLLTSRVIGESSTISYSDFVKDISEQQWRKIQKDCIANYGSLSELLS